MMALMMILLFAMYLNLVQRVVNIHMVVLDKIIDIHFHLNVEQLPRGSAAACANPPAPQSSEAAAAAAASPALKHKPNKIFSSPVYFNYLK